MDVAADALLGRRRDARSRSREADEPGPTADAALDAVLDEVRLDPDAYKRLADRSLLTALARNAAASFGVDVSSWAREAALEEERRARGLLEPEDLDTWLDENDLGRAGCPRSADGWRCCAGHATLTATPSPAR